MSASEQQEENSGVPYREAMGSLLFVAKVTRPDIEYAVNIVSQYVDKFNNTQWNAIKKIFRYLAET